MSVGFTMPMKKDSDDNGRDTYVGFFDDSGTSWFSFPRPLWNNIGRPRRIVISALPEDQ